MYTPVILLTIDFKFKKQNFIFNRSNHLLNLYKSKLNYKQATIQVENKYARNENNKM